MSISSNALPSSRSNRRQGIFWMFTIPYDSWQPPSDLPDWCTHIIGQAEVGEETGYHHWQVCVAFKRKQSQFTVRRFIPGHGILTISRKAQDYCEKVRTSQEGTKFELGTKPICRNSSTDWDSVWGAATTGDLQLIPPHIRLVSYRTIRAIASDYAVPQERSLSVYFFFGCSGGGKSFEARQLAGPSMFRKDPTSRFWCGYGGEESVIIDEFRGGVDISCFLLWLDDAALRMEVKGGSVVAKFTKLFVTSNLHPRLWYPNLDYATFNAIVRRVTVAKEFTERHPLCPPVNPEVARVLQFS